MERSLQQSTTTFESARPRLVTSETFGCTPRAKFECCLVASSPNGLVHTKDRHQERSLNYVFVASPERGHVASWQEAWSNFSRGSNGAVAGEGGDIGEDPPVIESPSGIFPAALAAFPPLVGLRFIPVIAPNISGT